MNLESMNERLKMLTDQKIRLEIQHENSGKQVLAMTGHINELSFIIDSICKDEEEKKMTDEQLQEIEITQDEPQ